MSAVTEKSTEKLNITRLQYGAEGFDARLNELLAWESVSDKAVNKAVEEILEAVKTRGDAAVVEYTNRFDRLNATSMAELEKSREELEAALQCLPDDQRPDRGNGSRPITNTRSSRPGTTPKPMAPCWASR